MRRDVKSRSVINSGLVCTLVSYVTVARFWWCFKMFYIRNNHSTVSRESFLRGLIKLHAVEFILFVKADPCENVFLGFFKLLFFRATFGNVATTYFQPCNPSWFWGCFFNPIVVGWDSGTLGIPMPNVELFILLTQSLDIAQV